MRVDLQKIDDLDVWLADPTNIWVGRDLGRKLKDVGFGNPFKIGTNGNRQQVIERYEKTCVPVIRMNKELLNRLHQAKQICCGCLVTEQCHGDLLLSL